MTDAPFDSVLARIKATLYWKAMECTVEDSPWHREANVACHTEMAISQYMKTFAPHRTKMERLVAQIALVFHDAGKPEAEETLERKDEPGTFYHRYAGHESISANAFMSFMCDEHELRDALFALGFTCDAIRAVKFMIEQHLPYGLKNLTKRLALRQAVDRNLGGLVPTYFDVLRSDAAGRISDDHATKLANVETWIEEFLALPCGSADKSAAAPDGRPTMFVLVGPSGAGKTTFCQGSLAGVPVVNEDQYRLAYAEQHLNDVDLLEWQEMSDVERYNAAWRFCHLDRTSRYDTFAREKFVQALQTRQTLVLDRTNQTRKARAPWIEAAKRHGYQIQAVEFYISERQLNERQRLRTDKFVPPARVHEMVRRMELPWIGPEVDGTQLVFALPADAG